MYMQPNIWFTLGTWLWFQERRALQRQRVYSVCRFMLMAMALNVMCKATALLHRASLWAAYIKTILMDMLLMSLYTVAGILALCVVFALIYYIWELL